MDINVIAKFDLLSYFGRMTPTTYIPLSRRYLNNR